MNVNHGKSYINYSTLSSFDRTIQSDPDATNYSVIQINNNSTALLKCSTEPQL